MIAEVAVLPHEDASFLVEDFRSSLAASPNTNAVREDLSIGRPCLIIDVIAGCWPHPVLIGRS